MARIEIDEVSKRFGLDEVVRNVSLDIDDGHFVVLVGPSGSGKTTLLRMLAGLEEITKGQIRIGGRVVNDMQPKDRDIAMVFQNYALYPNMTVFQNMAFGLQSRHLPAEEIRRRVKETSRNLGIDRFLDRKPHTLSGGQRQRVAMGRAIVREPQAFLMDEPLSNLDAQLRVRMRAEVTRLQHKLGVTTVYVTHDQTEAMTMGDRVAVLRDGSLQQVGNPEHLYDRPTNLFVARFLGSPAMNLFRGTLHREHERWLIMFDSQRLELGGEWVDEGAQLASLKGREVIVGLRPEHLTTPSRATGPSDGRCIDVRVNLIESLGAEQLLHLELPGGMRHRSTADLDVAGTIEGEDSREDLVAKAPRSVKAHEGDNIRLQVQSEHLHLFSVETGEAIRRGK